MATKTDASPEDTEAEAENPKKSKKRLFIIIGVFLLLGVVYQFVLAPGGSSDETASDEIKEGAVVPIPELVLNLADADEIHYLRVGIALVLEQGTSADGMADELPIASDVAVDYLSSKTFDELRQPGAKPAAKTELSSLVRAAYGDAKVARVIFTSFVMQ